MTLELEGDHLGELAAVRARQLEGLHGDERARQAEPDALQPELAGIQLGLEMSAGKILQLHGETLHPAPAGDDRHREPVAPQVDSRPNPHDHDLPASFVAGLRSGMGRQDSTVTVGGGARARG